MRILAAPDSFKGSLGAPEAAAAIARAARKIWGGAEVAEVPLADGGEGTVGCIRSVLGGQTVSARVTGPLGAPVMASYLLAGDTAFIEMASASGLPLAGPAPDPLTASTRGTGELIAHAARRARRIVLGVGGSATVDGGVGALSALGFRFLDGHGRPVPGGGGHLASVATVDASDVDDAVLAVELVVASDVLNPLLGPDGAASVFGPQKGAGPSEVEILERGLRHLSWVTREATGRDMATVVHGGAAGGLAAGLWAHLDAALEPGAGLVLDTLGFDRRLQGASLVITGEGRLDRTSWTGKVLSEVVARSSAVNVPVVAVVGSVADEEIHVSRGLRAWGSIAPGPASMEDLTLNAAEWLEAAALRHLRWLVVGGHLDEGGDR